MYDFLSKNSDPLVPFGESSGYSTELRDFVMALLEKDPNNWPSIDTVSKDPFLWLTLSLPASSSPRPQPPERPPAPSSGILTGSNPRAPTFVSDFFI